MEHPVNYRALWAAGELTARAARAREKLSCCDLCPHTCRVNRRDGQGFCRSGDRLKISGYGPHFGEEDVLTGSHGSGTIFFSGCNLGCLFCQNWDTSHLRHGEIISEERLASVMLELQSKGCHNINLVTPSHFLPQILTALETACARGLHLPLVYNCGGYEAKASLQLLDGIIDLYMPDIKFADETTARRLTGAKNYFPIVKAALKEMHRQVGDLIIDADGIARRGLLVRHLVLPEGLAGTEEITRFIAEEISPDTYINIMAQYHPYYRAGEHPPLDRPLTAAEYKKALATARRAGLHRLA